MQVFKSFFKLLKSYIFSVILYSVIFISICIMLSNTRKETQIESFSSTKLNIAIIDHDNSLLSKKLSSYLETIHNRKELVDDTEKMQDALYYRNVEYILIISKGFEDNIKNENYDQLLTNVKIPDSFQGALIDNQIDQYIKTLRTYLNNNVALDAAADKTKETLEHTTEVTLYNEKTNSKTEDITAYYQYFVYIIISILLSSLGPILASYNRKERASSL